MSLLPRPRTIRPGTGTLALPLAAAPETRIGQAPAMAPEGYRLIVTPSGVTIEAADAAGAFYARATLGQLARIHAAAGALPVQTIEDAPDLASRGVMLDISRDKVPSMGTLYRLIDELASLKVNRLQLYMEHTFAYPAHRVVWEHASPLTGEEVESLDAYARERFVELVPNQNSFGHMERWLKHPAYAPLAECDDTGAEYRSLCPVDPRSLVLLAGLYDELLPHFSSRSFNVGCDETIDLGKGRSREAVQSRGAGRVYLDFLEKIHALVAARGRRMQFWGDIVLQHPELIPELPKDVIALEWGYEADHPFDDEGARFAASGIAHHVCPGTSSWLSLAGRTRNALGNIGAAKEAAVAHGAAGMLVTDWGDLGHWQPLPIAYPGLAYGAACMWGRPVDRVDLGVALDAHVLEDTAAVLGRLLLDLGDVHLETGVTPKNATVLALLLLFPERPLGEGRLAGLTAEGLERAAARADEVLDPLRRARPERDDAALLIDEIALAGDLLRHACRFGLARLASPQGEAAGIPARSRAALSDDLERVLEDYRRIWRARNREGGLADSAARFERLLAIYRG
jgi:hexosaminidase